ncbi:hypothetical protein [Mucilaginibacter pallidiroseus]|uniref:hypothetical protein n=1 Tax=Mucilaginibacter pallidiroseus TaxID=2599295 RepID=UPI00164573F6|nr:hypothetical protein [Mucilaginibacter pallidiroseus]
MAADILYCLTDRYDWIAAELENQIVFMMRDGTAAIQLRGKKIINSLHTKSKKPEFL